MIYLHSITSLLQSNYPNNYIDTEIVLSLSTIVSIHIGYSVFSPVSATALFERFELFFPSKYDVTKKWAKRNSNDRMYHP